MEEAYEDTTPVCPGGHRLFGGGRRGSLPELALWGWLPPSAPFSGGESWEVSSNGLVAEIIAEMLHSAGAYVVCGGGVVGVGGWRT